MNREVNEYLRENEQILWQGQPEAFPLLDESTKISILSKWILAPLLSIGFIWTYLRNRPEPEFSMVAAVLLVAAAVVVSPLLERRNLLGQRYWVTDRRVIMLTRDKSFYQVELEDVDDIRITGEREDQRSLVIGSEVIPDIRRQLRWRACHPKIDLTGAGARDSALGLVFYCVRNVEGAAGLIRSRSSSRTVQLYTFGEEKLEA